MATGTRLYGGVAAEERAAQRRTRFVEAALRLIGRGGIPALTVRGVVDEAGLAARYFYESFPSTDALAIEVFSQVIEEAATRSLSALANAPAGRDRHSREARIRLVLAEMVDLMLDDPNKGRLLLLEAQTSPILAERVRHETLRFAGMLAATATTGDPLGDAAAIPAETRLAGQFLIGGMSAAIAAVLRGDIPMTRDQLTDTLVGLFRAVDRGR